MTEEEARYQIMDYLYDEMGPDQKKEFERILEQSPELQNELKELNSTRELIQSAPSEVPAHKMLMMMPVSDPDEPESDSGLSRDETQKSFFNRYRAAAVTLSAAASLLIILIGAALADLNMGQDENGFYLTFGERPQLQEQVFTRDEVYDLMEQMQQQNNMLMASMIEELQQRQQEQLTEAVGVMADYVEEQRQEDLRLISRSLVQLQENTYNRFRRTDETLGDLIYAISYQQTQPIEE